jgi:hypothetical protein
MIKWDRDQSGKVIKLNLEKELQNVVSEKWIMNCEQGRDIIKTAISFYFDSAKWRSGGGGTDL